MSLLLTVTSLHQRMAVFCRATQLLIRLIRDAPDAECRLICITTDPDALRETVPP